MNGFVNRRDAGCRLAAALRSYASEHPLVLGLPRGGVPVAYEIARALNAPLDTWVVRKVGVPWHPELGVGAVAESGYLHLNQRMIDDIGLSREEVDEVVETKRREVEERVKRYRGDRPRPELKGRTVILVDDGVATGGSVRAAIHSIRAEEPRAIVLAVPVGAPDTIEALGAEVDRVVCLHTPAGLYAIGLWYVDFSQVRDEEVVELLDRGRREGREREVAHALE